jgi:MFS family permease
VPQPQPSTDAAEARAAWRALRPTTWGMFALAFMAAFESLAVTTVMPTVAERLDGTELYAFAFAGTVAAGVVGMVAAGRWADRDGPGRPLVVAAATFAAGLVVAGLAPTMPVLVAGRLVQGLGGGALSVVLYVVVGRLYPAVVQPRVFAGFSAAWVLPSLVGPPLAGLVAQHAGWRWVFLGVALLTVPVAAVVLPAVLRVGAPPVTDGPAAGSAHRLAWATLAAAGVLGLNLAAQAEVPWSVVLAGLATVVSLAALRPLVPRGTLRMAAGLPAVIGTRGLLAGAFFGAEVYLPFLLIEDHGFSPTTAGVTLTAAAITWASASWVQGRLGDRLPHARAITVGTVLVALAVVGVTVSAWLHLPPAYVIASWAVSGAGMGLTYARQTVLVLAYSTPGTQGTNSSALTTTDSLGAALSLAVTGLVFNAAGAHAFAPTLAVTAVLAVGSALAATRIRRPAGEAQAEETAATAARS